MPPASPRCRSPSSQSGKLRGPGVQPPKPPSKSLPGRPGSAAAPWVSRGACGPSCSGAVAPPGGVPPVAAPKHSSAPSHRQGPRAPSAARRPSRCRGLGGASGAGGRSGGRRATAALAGGTLSVAAGPASSRRWGTAAGGAAGVRGVVSRLLSAAALFLPGGPVLASLAPAALAASAASASAAAAAAARAPRRPLLPGVAGRRAPGRTGRSPERPGASSPGSRSARPLWFARSGRTSSPARRPTAGLLGPHASPSGPRPPRLLQLPR